MKIICLVIVFIAFASACVSAQKLHHDLHVKLNIAGKSIEVVDSMHISFGKAGGGIANFKLNANLRPLSLDPMVKISEVAADTDTSAKSIAVEYKLELPAKAHGSYVVPIRYTGKIDGGIKAGAAEYARGFSSTSGIISDSGVYLAGSTYWIPTFEGQLFTFSLNVNLDKDWNVVSQGERTVNTVLNNRRNVRYESNDPMDEVYLISLKWTEFSLMAGDVEVQAFLR